MPVVLLGGPREGEEVEGSLKTVRKKRCEVNTRIQGQAELSSAVVIRLELECFEICIAQTILEKSDLSVLCFCDGKNLVLQEW